MERLYSVDILRGLAMIIMALDHVRDFFHYARFDPLDLTRTTAILFITRWITHHCAPVFVFLAGTGAFLALSRGKSEKELAKFLLSRGIWLIFLELSVIRLAWFFNFEFTQVYAMVIWAIGWSMIALAGLIFLPRWAIAVAAFGMIGLHNLFDQVSPADVGSLDRLWQILHIRSYMDLGTGIRLNIIYPLIPWIGVMAAGYLFGGFLLTEKKIRNLRLYLLGGGLIVGFIVLRALNIYGDQHPWSVQENLLKTFLSFIDTHKYPPSLLYLMMTLGPAILVMPWLDNWRGKIGEFVRVFGRVPLFYYILHLYLIHLMALVLAWITMPDVGFIFGPFRAFPPAWGFSLWTVYLVWISVIMILYPPSKWFAELKQKRRDKWLSYL